MESLCQTANHDFERERQRERVFEKETERECLRKRQRERVFEEETERKNV